jgi:hypothetical protein
MKQLVFILSVFSSHVFAVSPADLIKQHIKDPKTLHEQLSSLKKDELVKFRDEHHNNTIHLIVQELMAVKDTVKDYEQLQAATKPLLKFLFDLGIPVNDLNNNGTAPHFLLYYADDKRTQELESYFESVLKAHPTYFSLKPQIRACTKLLKSVCCFCCDKPKNK